VLLSTEQEERRAAFRAFADERIAPEAGRFDADGAIDPGLIGALAERGWLAAVVGPEYGGAGMDAVTFGLLCEEVGRACSSTRSLLTVHNMVAATLGRWGTPEQRERWLGPLVTGEAIAAFGLTEPEAGSDAKAVAAPLHLDGEAATISGRKLWVTFGQRADVFLVVGAAEQGPTALLVEADAPGLSREPVQALGLRGAMLADIVMDGCRVPAANVVGRPGLGFSHIAATVLDHGRYSVAWGSVGIAQASLDAGVAHAARRRQFGKPLREHQLVRRLISEMLVDTRAARLMCLSAGVARDARSRDALAETMMAKYAASTAAWRAADAAVQIHGAQGVSPAFPVERLLRDARIMRIIEGSDEMQQLTIAEFGLRGHS
jgi:hypothetical protein